MQLWDYAVTVYSLDGVKDRLLRLQDHHGCDVNEILWSLWCGREGIVLTSDQAASIIEAAATITEQAIRPLRRTRLFLSRPQPGDDTEAFASLRKDVLALELRTEELVLRRLEKDTLALEVQRQQVWSMEEIAATLFTLTLKPMDKRSAIDDESDPESREGLFSSILSLAKDHGP